MEKKNIKKINALNGPTNSEGWHCLTADPMGECFSTWLNDVYLDLHAGFHLLSHCLFSIIDSKNELAIDVRVNDRTVTVCYPPLLCNPG